MITEIMVSETLSKQRLAAEPGKMVSGISRFNQESKPVGYPIVLQFEMKRNKDSMGCYYYEITTLVEMEMEITMNLGMNQLAVTIQDT